MLSHNKPLWLIIGGRMRLGRWIAEDLSRDHELILTSSKSWEEESWHHKIPSIQHALRWDACSADIYSRITSDLNMILGACHKLNGVAFLSSTFEEQIIGTWNAEAIERTFKTNLIFPMLCSQALLPHLHPNASLHYFLDYAIKSPFKKRLPYSAAKAGLANFIEGLNLHLNEGQSAHGHILGTIIKEGEHQPAILHTPPHPFSALIKTIRDK